MSDHSSFDVQEWRKLCYDFYYSGLSEKQMAPSSLPNYYVLKWFDTQTQSDAFESEDTEGQVKRAISNMPYLVNPDAHTYDLLKAAKDEARSSAHKVRSDERKTDTRKMAVDLCTPTNRPDSAAVSISEQAQLLGEYLPMVVKDPSLAALTRGLHTWLSRMRGDPSLQLALRVQTVSLSERTRAVRLAFLRFLGSISTLSQTGQCADAESGQAAVTAESLVFECRLDMSDDALYRLQKMCARHLDDTTDDPTANPDSAAPAVVVASGFGKRVRSNCTGESDPLGTVIINKMHFCPIL
jgi:hypothetical protein